MSRVYFGDETVNGIEFTKVNSGNNGISRVVVHFLVFLKDEETIGNGYSGEQLFNIALNRAKELGGKKYRAEWYGGGIVFQCQNERILSERINELMEAVK